MWIAHDIIFTYIFILHGLGMVGRNFPCGQDTTELMSMNVYPNIVQRTYFGTCTLKDGVY
jgi:hypothetical protein